MTRVFLLTEPNDLRKSLDGPFVLVEDVISEKSEIPSIRLKQVLTSVRHLIRSTRKVGSFRVAGIERFTNGITDVPGM